MAMRSTWAMTASHLPTTIWVEERWVRRRRSRVFPTRSAVIDPAARTGRMTAAAKPKSAQKKPWKSWLTSRRDPKPSDRLRTQNVMRRNIAAWRRMNVQAKAPDCTPWRSSLTSIGLIQAGKSSPGQRAGFGAAAGARLGMFMAGRLPRSYRLVASPCRRRPLRGGAARAGTRPPQYPPRSVA